MPPLPSPAPAAAQWTLDERVVFLNHGSFGATPRVVLEHQSELRAELEREPVHWFVRRYQDLLDEARERVAAFVGADPEGFAFVPNATSAVNAILRSLDFAPGDELLTTDHVYGACREALRHVAGRCGARVVTAEVPFPLNGPDEVVEALEAAFSPRTRLLLIDHVTSPSGLVFPVEEILSRARDRGLPVLVDGAHAPGMLPLDLGALDADFYTGNLHKWPCAPKGAAFLQVHPKWRERIHPLVISHGAGIPPEERSRFRLAFDWCGTDDPTPWLCAPFALAKLGEWAGSWEKLRAHNDGLARRARDLLCEGLGIAPPAPASMLASLATIPLPDGPANPPRALYVDPLQERLWRRHAIEVPVSPWKRAPGRVLRVSAHLHNAEAQYRYLLDALRAELDEEGSRT
jgi:isopenicillin-N epimerase